MKGQLLDGSNKEIPRVELVWSEIYFSVQMKDHKSEILKGIKGSAEPGEFLAIMGSSGAGKTTLLNILSNRVQESNNVKFSGDVMANNQSIDEINYKNYIGYVTQEDILIDCMTVKESLIFSARLRVEAPLPTILDKVETIIMELKLDRCRDTLIGSSLVKGVSGGERKRASIGIELVTNPSVLFLDEPTSGLDSNTALVVVSLLLEQAKKGRTIITTIHQPSSDIFHKFDKLLLMTDGHIVFHGRADSAMSFFENCGYHCPEQTNPADYFIEVLHNKKPGNLDEEERAKVNKLLNAYKSSGFINKIRSFELKRLEEDNGVRTKSFWFQFYMNFMRFGLRMIRNPILSVVKVFSMTLVGFFIDLFYWQISDHGERGYRDRNGVLFYIVVTLIFSNVQASVLSFPLMRTLMIKEYSSNMYGIFAFFLAKNLIDFIYDVLIIIYFGNIVYWAIGLTTESFYHVAMFFIFCVFTQMAGGSLGFVIGTMFKRPDVAVAFIAISVVPFMYFSGFYRNDQIPTAFRWIENISIFKYSFQGLARNEWLGQHDPEVCGPGQLPGTCPTALELLGITMSIRESLYLLVVLVVVLRLIALGLLYLTVKKNKS